MEPHKCIFPDIVINTAGEDDDPLKPGMHVLAPCEICGEWAIDHMDWLENHCAELDKVVLGTEPRRALFHWAPTARRKQIIRYGLRPQMRPTTSSDIEDWRAPVICLGDSPSWAWALSGAVAWAPVKEWDLWQTTLDLLKDPVVLPSLDRSSGIHEVRTEHRIYKRDIWYVASRTKD